MKKLVILYIASLSSSLYALPIELYEFNRNDPVILGQGWNSQTGQSVPSNCLLFKEQAGSDMEKKIFVERIKDNYTLARKMNVGFNASLGAIVDKKSASVSFAENYRTDHASETFLVNLEVVMSPRFVVPKNDSGSTVLTAKSKLEDIKSVYANSTLSLRPELKKLAKSNINEFYRKCGDGFVSVIHEGGQLIGVVKFYSDKTQKSNATDVRLKAQGTGYKVEASFNSLVSEIFRTEHSSISIEELGGNRGTIAIDKYGLIDAVQTFPGEVLKAPKKFRFVVTRYDQLPDWDFPIYQREMDKNEYLVKAYWKLISLRQEIYSILENPTSWVMRLDTKKYRLQSMLDEIKRDMQDLSMVTRRCTLDSNCSIGKWSSFSDYEYRKRLPAPGQFQDYFNSEIYQIDTSIRKMMNARSQYWIEDIAQFRCDRMNDCDLNYSSELPRLKSDILDSIAREM